MALQINRTLTTNSGFTVPAGAYVWLMETRGQDSTGLAYSVRVDLIFFKDKESFDAKRARFTPDEVPGSKQSFLQTFTALNYGNLTPLQVHTYVRDQLEVYLGAGTVTIVQ